MSGCYLKASWWMVVPMNLSLLKELQPLLSHHSHRTTTLNLISPNFRCARSKSSNCAFGYVYGSRTQSTITQQPSDRPRPGSRAHGPHPSPHAPHPSPQAPRKNDAFALTVNCNGSLGQTLTKWKITSTDFWLSNNEWLVAHFQLDVACSKVDCSVVKAEGEKSSRSTRLRSIFRSRIGQEGELGRSWSSTTDKYKAYSIRRKAPFLSCFKACRICGSTVSLSRFITLLLYCCISESVVC